MSNIYYLKATSETAMWEAMEAQGIAYKEYDPFDPANQEPIDNPVDWEPSGAYTWKATGDIDLIGTIFVVTGQDPEGRDIYGPLDNFYYANLKDSLTTDQVAGLPTIPAPTSPYRIWLGEKNV